MFFSPARDLPQQSSSSGNSLAPEMVESETPPRASPPHAADDTEVLSQRTSSGHGEVREATKTVPEGNASAAENMGGTTPMETDDGGPDQSGPSRTPFWRPMWLQNRASTPLQRSGGSAYSDGDLP